MNTIELSVDNLYNQIVKSSIQLLVKQKDVKKERKVKLLRLLVFFNDVARSTCAKCNGRICALIVTVVPTRRCALYVSS